MKISNIIRKFGSDRKGNIAVIFAITLLPLTMSVAAAIDYSEGSRLQTKIANATDAALLAATSGVMEGADLDDKQIVLKSIQKNFEPFLMANMPKSNRYKYRGFDVSYNPATRNISVDVKYDYRTSIMKIVGRDIINADVSAATKIQMSAGGAVSMFLVLDKSGSMGWDKKMNTLKTAVQKMTEQFEKIDPKHSFVRMGAVSYDSRSQRPLPITWGVSRANSYVQALRAYGGTNSSQAVKRAHQALRHPREQKLHQSKSGQDPTKVMVFMTDGSNNRSSYDRSTIRTCNRAKKDKIEIYTVAFKAPRQGQQLLEKCASDAAHYFNATNAQDLIKAFKRIGASVGEKLVLSK